MRSKCLPLHPASWVCRLLLAFPLSIPNLLKVSSLVSHHDEEAFSEEVLLDPEGCYTVSACVIPTELGPDICLARVMVKWSRLGSSDVITTLIAVPSVNVDQPPITIRTETPEVARLGENFQVSSIFFLLPFIGRGKW
jgi:hypothetical protein